MPTEDHPDSLPDLREHLRWALRQLRALVIVNDWEGDAFTYGRRIELAGFVTRLHAAEKALKAAKGPTDAD